MAIFKYWGSTSLKNVMVRSSPAQHCGLLSWSVWSGLQSLHGAAYTTASQWNSSVEPVFIDDWYSNGCRLAPCLHVPFAGGAWANVDCTGGDGSGAVECIMWGYK